MESGTLAMCEVKEVKSDSSSSIILRVGRWIWNTIFHQILAVITIYAIWVPIQQYSTPFSWHVILSTLGLIPLMAESFILFFNDNVWSQELSRKTKYWIHGIVVFIATLLVVTGVALEIDRQERSREWYGPDFYHFESYHALTGVISMVFIILALACGPLAFTSAKFGKFVPPVWFKFLHNLLGQTGYIIGILSLILGYYTHWFVNCTTEGSRIAVTIATVVVTLWSLVCAWKSAFNQTKSIVH